MFRLARLSLGNRAIVALVSIAIVAFGVFAVFNTNQELFPSLSEPAATVTTVYPGASAQIVDREVTQKIDDAVAEVDDVESRTSTSNTGLSSIQVQFAFGKDMKEATSDLKAAIDGISADLPDDVEPQVFAGSTEDIPVVVLAASADLSERQLAQRLDDRVVPELKGIEGVRDVSVSGARTDRVMITLNQKKLKKKNLTTQQVLQALQANGVATPGGDLTTNGRTSSVEVGNTFASLAALRKLPIAWTSGGGAGAGGGGAGGGGQQGVPPQQGAAPQPGQGGQGGGGQGGQGGGQQGGGQQGGGQQGGGQQGGGQQGGGQQGAVPQADPTSDPTSAPTDSPTGDPTGTPTPTCTPTPTPTPEPGEDCPTPTPTDTSPTPTPTTETPTPTTPPTAPTLPSQPPGGQQQIPQFPQLPPGGLPPGGLPPGGLPPGGVPTPKTHITELHEIADVARQLSPTTTITRTDGKQSLGITVTKTSEANTVEVSERVREKLSTLEDAVGANAKLTTVFDQAPMVSQSIHDLTNEGVVGLIFAVLVILLFLLSFRSTIVTALSIPFSLLLAVIGLYVGGYSFDLLTLGALTIAVGRVVDDSIVVLENIKRHLGYGEEKRDAILTAVREVAGAVTASTLTTVGVFLPIAFVGGIVAQLFRPFAITVTVALLASLLVSLTIVPVLAYWFLKVKKLTPEERERVEAEALAKERRNPLQRVYVPMVRWVTRHRFLTVAAGVLVFVATIGSVPLLQTNFLGDMGQNVYQISQTMPRGTSLAKTDAAARKVENVLKDMDGVDTYQVTVGSAGGYGPGLGSAGNSSTFQVTTETDIDQTRFLGSMRKELAELSGVGDVSVASAAEGGASTIEVDVHAADGATLREATERVEDAVKDVPDTTEVTNNLADDLPTVQVDVNRTKAARKGLSEAQIGMTVRQAFEGDKAGTVVLGGDQYDVLVRGTAKPASLADVRDLKVGVDSDDETIRVDDVASVHRVDRPAEITRSDGERTATVSATPVGSDTGAVSRAVQAAIAELQLPAGATVDIGGVTQQQNEAFSQLYLAIGAAIAIVFVVMVAALRSIIQPLILLVSIPFAATGAIGLLLATGVPLGLPALIGMLMLVGIVVTNAIVLIDLINQYRQQGMSVRDAVVEGGRHRLRPILMTAVATICALTPMALGLTGGGAFISQPLAIVVIGGLVTSTLLTLLLVPTLYTMVEGRKERRRRKRAAKHGGEDEPTAPLDGVGPAPAS